MADDDQHNGDDKEMVSKADLDAALARSDKLEKDLEDVRMEVLTPEYQKFLDADDKTDDKTDDKNATDTTISDDKFTKMTNKEIFDLAVSTAKNEIQSGISKREEDVKTVNDARTKREIAVFAKDHEDYEVFRPIMYGLSLDPKNADKSLDQLYSAAKDHVKSIHKEPTDEEKKRSRASSNEKPGGDSSSLEKLAKMTNDEIAREAMTEVREKLGGFSTE